MSATTGYYAHVFSLCFGLTSCHRSGADVTPTALRAALHLRLSSLSHSELLEAVGSPDSSCTISNARPR
jgi:hypothetical protein